MDPDRLRRDLLAWYDSHARELPWRVGPVQRASVRPNPYRVWLSEVMLQQTTVPHATRYFLEFTRRWPTVKALAAAPEADVMAAWAGLGYYARARNLIACARAVAEEHGGRFPRTEAELLTLPGVGAYTAAAVAAIAFDRPANVVDGNVERVVARLFAAETPLPQGKAELKALAASLVTPERPGDWAQCLMDVGAVICRPSTPQCGLCPIAAQCAARASGAPEAFPRKTTKAARPRRTGVAYVLTCRGRVGLERRPARGLLGGMLGLPTSGWGGDAPEAVPPPAIWRSSGQVAHVFTHFSLDLQVLAGETDHCLPAYEWMPHAEARLALPSVFRKALDAALSHQTPRSSDAPAVAEGGRATRSRYRTRPRSLRSG